MIVAHAFALRQALIGGQDSPSGQLSQECEDALQTRAAELSDLAAAMRAKHRGRRLRSHSMSSPRWTDREASNRVEDELQALAAARTVAGDSPA